MSRAVENVKGQAEGQRGGVLARLFPRYFSANRLQLPPGKDFESASGLPVETVSLSGKELRVLEISQTGTISCLEGVVWITFPHRFCDYVLKAGESLSLRGEGRLVVSGGCRKAIIGISVN